MDPNFVKLFRLAQLTIEYLLVCIVIFGYFDSILALVILTLATFIFSTLKTTCLRRL